MEQETLEEAAANLADPNICKTDNWIAGANWQAEKMYSEEDMRKAYDQGIDDSFDIGFSSKDDTNFNVFIEQFKKK
jgi:flagellar biosynthesis chaperone FliJ